MPIVRIEHAVPDFEKWKTAFDRDPADRKGSGVRRYHVLRAADDPRFVMIDLELDTMEEATAFLRTMERIWTGPGASVMRSPRARIVELVESVEVE
ncbi:MAG: hypothetical protein ACM3JJ_05960 [Hyphomicrobiales bacterium]